MKYFFHNQNSIILWILKGVILLFISSCSLDETEEVAVSYIHIPDSSFESILISKHLDTDGIVNQRISRSDAELITALNLENTSFGDIESLEGIEGFKNLKKLNAYRHQISEIDVSANTKLDSLILSANNISTIDLSNNSNLTYVEISYNNLSSIVGLSGLQQLKKLMLSGNYFADITINNPSVENVLITDNQLNNIDLSDAINLKSIMLTNNKLQSLDLSKNEKLETLVVSANELKNINLFTNEELRYFYASSNLLEELDVSNNLHLVDLRVDRNPDLFCIKINDMQNILSVSLSSYQTLNSNCN